MPNMIRKLEAMERRLGTIEGERGKVHRLCLVEDGETVEDAMKRKPDMPWKRTKYVTLDDGTDDKAEVL